MFIPTKIGADEYVDGGLVSPVPVDVARKLGADIIIAVDILAQPMYTETSNIWGLFNQNINIMQKNLAQIELKNADIVIQPDLREKVHIFDVSGRELTMQAGVDATVAQLGQIQKFLRRKIISKNWIFKISKRERIDHAWFRHKSLNGLLYITITRKTVNQAKAIYMLWKYHSENVFQ